jgi:hypothetical protein
VSLNAALVDRARRLVDTPLGTKVEGSTQFATVEDAWFKCRLTLGAAPEADDSTGARRRVSRTGSVLCGVKDLTNEPLTILATDRLEINSKELGRYIFDVTDDPAPLRKKRKLIGWSITVVRVVENEFVTPRL